MEDSSNNTNKKTGSSSSFTDDLFGAKPRPKTPSAALFDSIFSSSSKVAGKEPLPYEGHGKKPDSVAETWNNNKNNSNSNTNTNKAPTTEDSWKGDENIFEQQKIHPCHLSSSIYYGGQDFYPCSNKESENNSSYKNASTEDESEGVSRGNWWKGSLYY